MLRIKSNIRLCTVLILVLSVFLVFTGCTQDHEIERSEIRFMLPGEPLNLDPSIGNETYTNAVLNHLFEPLVKEDENGQLIPGAAATWDVSSNNTQFVFHLRQDAYWSNGSQVTAQDFKDAWLRIISPNNDSGISGLLTPYISGAQSYFEGTGSIDDVGIKVINDFTLQVNMQAPVPYFLEILSFPRLGPIHIETVNTDVDNWDHTPELYITNGPFMMHQYTAGESIALIKNPHYWNRENIAIDDILVLFRKPDDQIATLYESGQVDVFFMKLQWQI